MGFPSLVYLGLGASAEYDSGRPDDGRGRPVQVISSTIGGRGNSDGGALCG